MASVKIVLRTNKRKVDNTCPLAIRITKDRIARYVFTGYYILEKDWDPKFQRVKKSYPNSARLNNLLLSKVMETTKLLIESEVNDDHVTSKDIKIKIKGSGSSKSFFDLAQERIESYKRKGIFSVANAEQSIINNLKKFTKNENITFKEITVSFIEKYKVFGAAELGQSSRTITNHLIFLRTMYNLAIKNGITDRKGYPFGGDNIKIKIGSGLKIGLTEEEIQRIEKLKLDKGTSIWHSRNVWLLSFYFAGIRISDVLMMRLSDFKDGRLNYVMHKNEKPVSLKVPDKAKVIIEYYKIRSTQYHDYVFPFLDEADHANKRDIFRKCRNAARNINKHLKTIAKMAEIDKNLSNHIARHSFGNIAGDKIHPLMLQKLYRHYDLKTTLNYQSNFIHKEADDALDSVIDF